MPNVDLIPEAKKQLEDIKKLVFEACYLDVDGNIKAKPGVTREQILYAIKCIKNIESIYNERIVDLDILNEEIDEHEKNVQTTRQKFSNFVDRFGSNVFPKWLLKAYGLR